MGFLKIPIKERCVAFSPYKPSTSRLFSLLSSTAPSSRKTKKWLVSLSLPFSPTTLHKRSPSYPLLRKGIEDQHWLKSADPTFGSMQSILFIICRNIFMDRRRWGFQSTPSNWDKLKKAQITHLAPPLFSFEVNEKNIAFLVSDTHIVTKYYI